MGRTECGRYGAGKGTSLGKRTYKGVVKERMADARYKIQTLRPETFVFRREDLKLMRQAVAVYRITDQATFKFDGCGYGYGHGEVSYRVEGLLDNENNPAVLDIIVSRNAKDKDRFDLKRMLRRYNIQCIDTGDASASDSSSHW